MNQDGENFFGEMSNYELTELAMIVQSTTNEAVAIYLSVLSAYLAVAYLAGDKLTKFQLYSITVIYSAWVAIQFAGFFQLNSLGNDIVFYTTGIDNSIPYLIGQIVVLASWLLSLAFMRHSRTQSDT